MNGVRVAVLGATGAVGSEMLKVMEEKRFPISELKLLADANDAGKIIYYNNKEYMVTEATNDSFNDVDITLVAVGNPVSLKFSPEAVKRGSIVIDNSSAYRMDPNVPLVIPEVNPEDIKWHKGIIANPNCSTTIALVALKPLHDYAKIKRIIVSTYQAVSGAGRMGIVELEEQSKQYLIGGSIKPEAFKYQIAYNVIPHIDEFLENDYTKEEMKMVNESRKILHDDNLKIVCTCVRVPVFRSHSESIVIETERKITAEKARELLGKSNGILVVDNPKKCQYPMPLDTSNQDLIFVGRIREDYSADNSLALWVCGDQVRKGAATNAIQIAELLLKEGLLG